MPDLPKWIELDEEGVLTRLSSPELRIVKTTLLEPGQTNPLPEIVRSVVASVRNAVAQNAQNVLAEGETIPFAALRHALAIIRSQLVTRIPKLAQALLDEVRQEEVRTAELWLRSKPLVEKPETAAAEDQQISGPAVELVTTPCREVTADGLRGF